MSKKTKTSEVGTSAHGTNLKERRARYLTLLRVEIGTRQEESVDKTVILPYAREYNEADYELMEKDVLERANKNCYNLRTFEEIYCNRISRADVDYLIKNEEVIIANRNNKSLAKIIGTITILVGIFFLSPNITGESIADLSIKTTSFLGAGLLIIGLVASFIWLTKQKK